MAEADKRLTAVVFGRVQGVSFRYYTLREANKLALNGWVANQRDGSVKVVAEGPEGKLLAMVEFLNRGSPGSRVENVQVDWTEAQNIYKGFEVRWL